MLADTVVVLDFETTGLSTRMDRATEVAAVMLRDGRIVDQYQTLINAGVPISPMVTQLTGITNAMLRGAPRPEEAFGRLREFIGTVPVVAHNASFDYGVYRAELARAGQRREPEPFLCTKLLSRRVLPGRSSYSLSPLAAELNVRYRSAAHRALADAEVCAQVLHALCMRIAELGIERVDVPLLQRLMRYTPVAKASTYLQTLARSRAPVAVVPAQRVAMQNLAVGSPRLTTVPLLRGWLPPRKSQSSSSITEQSPLPHAPNAEPDPMFKLKVLAQARAEEAEWVYLESHRCLMEVVSGEAYHVLGLPQDSAGILTFTLKTRPPVRVDRLKLLRW